MSKITLQTDLVPVNKLPELTDIDISSLQVVEKGGITYKMKSRDGGNKTTTQLAVTDLSGVAKGTFYVDTSVNCRVFVTNENKLKYEDLTLPDISTLKTFNPGSNLGVGQIAKVIGQAELFELTLGISGETTGNYQGVEFTSAINGYHWKRLFDGPLHSKWFGVVADGITDDTAAVTAIRNYVEEHTSAYVKKPRKIIWQKGFTVCDPISWDTAASLWIQGEDGFWGRSIPKMPCIMPRQAGQSYTWKFNTIDGGGAGNGSPNIGLQLENLCFAGAFPDKALVSGVSGVTWTDAAVTNALLWFSENNQTRMQRIQFWGGPTGTYGTSVPFKSDGCFEVIARDIFFDQFEDWTSPLVLFNSALGGNHSAHTWDNIHFEAVKGPLFQCNSGSAPTDLIFTNIHCELPGGDLIDEIIDDFDAATAVDTGADTITLTTHPFIDGDPVYYEEGTGAIGGLTDGTVYYVIYTDANTIQLEATVGGGAIDLTSTGTGTANLFSDYRCVTSVPLFKFVDGPTNLVLKGLQTTKVGLRAENVGGIRYGYQTIFDVDSDGTINASDIMALQNGYFCVADIASEMMVEVDADVRCYYPIGSLITPEYVKYRKPDIINLGQGRCELTVKMFPTYDFANRETYPQRIFNKLSSDIVYAADFYHSGDSFKANLAYDEDSISTQKQVINFVSSTDQTMFFIDPRAANEGLRDGRNLEIRVRAKKNDSNSCKLRLGLMYDNASETSVIAPDELTTSFDWYSINISNVSIFPSGKNLSLIRVANDNSGNPDGVPVIDAIVFDVEKTKRIVLQGDTFDASSDADAGADTLTLTGHAFEDEDYVFVSANGNTLPTGLAEQAYYVIYVDANTIQLETAIGSGAVDITATGTGTCYIGETEIVDHRTRTSQTDGGAIYAISSSSQFGAVLNAHSSGIQSVFTGFNANINSGSIGNVVGKTNFYSGSTGKFYITNLYGAARPYGIEKISTI